MMLSNKWRISFDVCPVCKSKKTFHVERKKTLEERFMKTGILYENCFDEMHRDNGNTALFVKFDLCLKCGYKWPMEIYCYEKIDGDIEKIKFIEKKSKKVKK